MSAYTITHGNIIPPAGGFQQPVPVVVPIQQFNWLNLIPSQIPARYCLTTTMERIGELEGSLEQVAGLSGSLQQITDNRAGLERTGTKTGTMERLPGLTGYIEEC